MSIPTAEDAQVAVQAARTVFRRTLSSWVCDLLELRSAGMDVPHWEPAAGPWTWREAA